MWEIINYLENNQDKARFPDREASFVRKHPYMTQLDFFDMQDEQALAWEEQNRKERQKEVAQQAGTSLALEDARGRRRPPPISIPGDDDDEESLISAQSSFMRSAYSEASTMRGQRGYRRRGIALSVRSQLSGLASNPGTDVPEPVEMPAAWHHRTAQQQYDTGGEMWRYMIDSGAAQRIRERDGPEQYYIISPGGEHQYLDMNDPRNDLNSVNEIPFGPRNQGYMEMVLSRIKDAMRSKPDDPELQAEYERIVEGLADHAAQREADYNAQAAMHQAASIPQRGWYDWMADAVGGEQDPTAGSSNDYASVTPISIATPAAAAASSSAAAASSTRRKETAAEQKARLIREGIAYDKKLAREDKKIAKVLAYNGRRV
jgi:hypothetical protein